MKLFYKLSLVSILMMLLHQESRSSTINGDTVIYKQVVDSLIQIALTHKQLHPIVIISESKRLRKPQSLNDESVNYIIRSYAEDSIHSIRNLENSKILENRQLRKILLSMGQLDRSNFPLSALASPAQIHYKANGWTVFKSHKKIKRFRAKKPDFFCVADITQPVFVGDYAIVVVDRQFNPLGGGGYMHIFQKVQGKWQTYAIATLWNY